MKSAGVLLITFGLHLSIPMQSQSVDLKEQGTQSSTSPISGIQIRPQSDTPAQRRILGAKQQIAANPKKAGAFNDLAIGHLRRARETADQAYLRDASAAVNQGLAIAPDDFQLSKTAIALLLAQGQFVAAKDKATQLNRHTPDDAMIYGFIAEADIALGDYEAAEQAAQWMLNMQPNNIPGLLLGAKLRVLYGDSDGALDLLNLAYKETSPIEIEDQAWIANQIAAVQIDSGKIDAAAAVLESAKQIFPDYPYTLENLARISVAQKRAKDAVSLLQEAAKSDSDPHVACELAHAQQLAGDLAGARAGFKACGDRTATSSSRDDAATRDSILLKSDDPATAPEGLMLAQKQFTVRHDVWTLDAYAWALYANGRFADAETTIQKALAVGIQSAQIYDHSAHIEQKMNHDTAASQQFELSIRANPFSEYAADARIAIKLPTTGANVSRELQQAPVSQQAASSTVASAVNSRDRSRLHAEATAPGSTRPVQNGSAAVFEPVPADLLTPRPSETERLIHNAQSNVAHAPRDPTLYTALGAAYFQRARETGDVNDYQLAEDSLTNSLDLDSADFSAGSALGAMAEVCMGEHRFSDALNYADRALALGSGDLSPFAIVGDAYADMGEYGKAGAAYSRLRPADGATASISSYVQESRLSYLKFVSGDTVGAIDQMRLSVQEGLQAHLPSENMAWLYYELGEYSMQAGDIASANAAYLAALKTHPGDYRALAALAKLRGAQGRTTEAITLYQRAIAVVPMPIYVAELGDLYQKSGLQAEAQKQYKLVEYIGLLGRINQVLHNRDLAVFYSDHDIKLAEALNLAQQELEVRHDIYTWDALAWALFKNGRYTDAEAASKKALQYGTQDPMLLFHAGIISEKLGQQGQASEQLKAALAINPAFHIVYSDIARQHLTLLSSRASRGSSGDDHAR